MSAIRWPWRRGDLAHHFEHSSDDDGFIPGTFEPEEQLGDTGPAPLDAMRRAKEDTSIPFWAWALAFAAFLDAVFWTPS